MIVSVHIADLGRRAIPVALRGAPRPGDLPGLRYAETVLTAPLGGGLVARPRLGQVGLIAAWEEDGPLDRFLASESLGRSLAGGWHVRLEPLRVSGSWAAMPGLPSEPLPSADEEAVAVLTLGRLRLRRAIAFLRASAPAEAQAVRDPALLASTGLARPPGLVSTFSLWRSTAEMRSYATRGGAPHRAALEAHRERPFHRESAFIRLRPYASVGTWNGRDPLAATELPSRSAGHAAP